MIRETALPASMRQRATGEIRGALPNRQVESFDERSVERRGVFGVGQRFLEPARSTDDRLSLDFDDSVISACLDDEPVKTRGPKDLTHDPSVVLEAVGDDEQSSISNHAVACVTQDSASVSVASSSDKSSRPQPGPNVDGREDPDGAPLTSIDRSNLIGLKLGDVQALDRFVVESSTARSCPFQPPIYGIPCDALDASDRGLADTLDAEVRDFV